MKTSIQTIRAFALLALLALFTLFIVAIASAQDATNSLAVASSGNAGADAAASIAAGLVAALTAKYGWLVAVITWIGVLRAAVKPIMLAIEAIVQATPSQQDDMAIAKFESGPVYKWLVWGLDWVASIKAPGSNTNPLTK